MSRTDNTVIKTLGKWLAVCLAVGALVAGVVASGILPVRIVLDKPQPAAGLTAPVAATPANQVAPVVTNQPAPVPAVVDFDMQERQDTAALVIPPKQQGRYRLVMQADYDLSYFWKTDGKTVKLTFRGEPTKPRGKEVKEFGKLTGPRGQGFFIPPYEGTYEWVWQNPNAQPVTVQISTKGIYPDKGQVVEGQAK